MKNSRDTLRVWKADPARFVRDVFKVEPDLWQLEVLKNLPDNMRMAMNACKGPGKTCCLAWIVLWFMTTHTHPKVICTSITGDNLSDGLWTELAKWINKSPLMKHLYNWGKTMITSREHPETWWAAARTWPRSGSSEQQADTLAGKHADNMLFVLDEAGGIPDAVMAAAEAALANAGDEGRIAHLVIAGNPTHTEGPLWRASTSEKTLWYVVEITGDPDDPKRSPRINREWAQQQIDKYGRDHPWVLVNVFGKFPPSSMRALISQSDIDEAQRRRVDESYQRAQKRLGVDVARFGEDDTVIFPRQGLVAFNPITMPMARSDEIAARIMVSKQRWGSEMEFIDDTGGYGSGVVDSLLRTGLSPQAVNFSSTANDRQRFQNRRAEMWFRMAEWIKNGGSLPKIPELAQELCAAEYTFNKSTGRLQIEDKELIKDKIGRSPDLADALALTFALPDMEGEAENLLRRLAGVEISHKAKTEYDPYGDIL